MQTGIFIFRAFPRALVSCDSLAGSSSLFYGYEREYKNCSTLFDATIKGLEVKIIQQEGPSMSVPVGLLFHNREMDKKV